MTLRIGDVELLSVSLEGSLFTRDLVRRVRDADPELAGTRAEDYHLAAGERLGDAASRHWTYLLGAYRTFRARLAAEERSVTAGGATGPGATGPGVTGPGVTGPGTTGTTLTRELWLQVLLGELGYGRVAHVRHLGEDDAISHEWRHVPVHLAAWKRDLDQRLGPAKSDRAPQRMMQAFLNRHDDRLWGILSNGRKLRILRESAALVGHSYLEFDLEAIFDGELYSDFEVLFAFAHASRFEAPDRAGAAPNPADCWLERWHTYAAAAGIVAGDKLRDNVVRAMAELGTGFLEANPGLRAMLAAGRQHGGMTPDEFRHELLRLVYQMVFLFVIEDRDVLHPQPPEEKPDETARQRADRKRLTDQIIEGRRRYASYFSTARLRRIASRRRGDQHGDLWRGLVLVLEALGSDGGRPELALPALGGLYFTGGSATGRGRSGGAGADDRETGADDRDARPDELRRLELPNRRLLAAVKLLSHVTDDRGRRQRVDFAHLGGAELGSVYESLLELVPDPDLPARRFRLADAPGNERKTTGSYFTPNALIDSLLRSALDPVIDRYAASGVPADLLRITVVDPACGSGHFLAAAAHRIARRYAIMDRGDDEPSRAEIVKILPEVVARCVYGVDINPLAVEITKFSLWLASVEPNRPLAYLDHHIKVGNALLGVTPTLLDGGIPDAAFKAFGDDDASRVRALLADNQGAVFLEARKSADISHFANLRGRQELREIIDLRALSLSDVREQARRYEALEAMPERRLHLLAANAWCAAFVWPKPEGGPPAITNQLLYPLMAGSKELSPELAKLLDDITDRYRFFHWHLEFPDVFRTDDDPDAPDANPGTGWRGGFSCVLGNPPWERVKLQEKEFFAHRDEKIAKAPNKAARQRLIDALKESEFASDRALYADFQDHLRESAGWSQLLRDSGRYPLTGRGDVNTYAVFAETARTILGPHGRAGLVLPTGIATDATTAPFFQDVVEKESLAGLVEFENEEFLLSRAVHHSFRFCLLTLAGRQVGVDRVPFAFGSRRMVDVADRAFTMTPAEIRLLNPNTRTVSIFRSPRDSRITLDIYRRVPVLWQDAPPSNPWRVSFKAMLHMANDSKYFHTRKDLEKAGWHLVGNVFTRGPGEDAEYMLPLIEAKMVHHFDHRLGTYEGQTQAQANMGTLPRTTPKQHADPNFVTLPRYWVAEEKVEKKIGERWNRGWLLGWRDIARASDERTLISGAIPRYAVGDKFLLALPSERGALLQANFSMFVLDYCARQKFAGTSFKYFLMKQLPVLPPERYDEPVGWLAGEASARWIEARVLELTYTAWDMRPFAEDLGDAGPPFVWDEERRFELRAELDAAYFHLYGVDRDDVGYILDSFRAFRNNDPERFERTKARILAIYDAMAAAEADGLAYASPLAPPAGLARRHSATPGHPRRLRRAQGTEPAPGDQYAIW